MRFSIVIPAYNASQFICRAVDSVLAQSYSDFEVIVVDDGSKDNTLETLNGYDDKRLKVISQPNQGVSVARNNGIQNAKGDYICFLDADDEFFEDHLRCLSDAINDYPASSFFVTRFCMTEMGDYTKVIMYRATGLVSKIDNVPAEMLKPRERELMCTGCVCIKSEMFDKYGLFEPGVKLCEDVDMWMRIYLRTGIVYIDRITVKINRDGSEATKEYQRTFDADPLNRMPEFLADDSISDEVKASLIREHEWKKLAVARSYIYVGEKEQALECMRQINRSLIPYKRWMITKVCLLIPSCIIRFAIRQKNKGLYN